MNATSTRDYRSALRAIWERSAYDRGFISNPFAGDGAADLGLRRTAAILDRLGRPHQRYGVIHVAGSKGKGSTSAFIDAMLTAAGYRVGRYTQPHLHSMRERIAVAGQPIDEPDFAGLTRRGLEAVQAVERDRPELGEITAFEMTTAMALAHFADVGCDLAVVEVGLGGTLDATNVVTPLVSVITALDLEHTAVLGDTLAKIAAQKAGIVKPGRPVAVSPQPPDALAVIESVAADQHSPLYVGGRDWHWQGSWRSFSATGPWGTLQDLTSGLIGTHQIVNACTAIAATWLLSQDHTRADEERSFAGAQDDLGEGRPPFSHPEQSEGPPLSLPKEPLDQPSQVRLSSRPGSTSRQSLTITEEHIRTGIANATWPGRFEVVTGHGPRIVLDGAHTPASARALSEALREDGSVPAVVVLGLLGDKDAGTIGEALAPVTERFIVTAPRSPRAASAAALADHLAALGLPVQTAPDVATALSLATSSAGRLETVVVTGSLSTVAEARQALGLGIPDPPVGD
jgi:dihydrofolate synthase/folylpolyglutamate synthase